MKSQRPAAATRAVFYARYSSDIQNDASIEDQFAVLEKYAKRQDFSVVHHYFDRAKSATSMFDKPGLAGLLAAGKRGEFDIVVVEATDRLSRDEADLPYIAKHLRFAGVKIHTPYNGEVTDLQIAFDGVSNPGFIKKLAERVKRGHDGIAKRGLVCGKRSYGYDLIANDAGARAINAGEAAIINRIFREYASGKSPRAIASDLTRDGIPSPSGNPAWNFQRIVGGNCKARGLIHNRLYVGEYVKNRYFNVRNPENGKVITRKADDDDLIVAQVPHLRIVEQALWDAAHAVRQRRGHEKFGASGQVKRAVVPRKPGLLSGLLRCAVCNGSMCITASPARGGQRVGCSAAHNHRSCEHGKTYQLAKLTDEAVKRMFEQLTDPEFLKEKARARAVEFARLEKENSGARQAAQMKFDRITMQIKKLVHVLQEADDIPQEIMDALKAKEIERKGLEERIRLLGAENNVTTLHPATLVTFGRNIETLHEKLLQNRDDAECRVAFHNIVDSVIVHPTGYAEGYEISIYARLSAIMGVDLFPAPRSNREIVAAEGLSARFATDIHETSSRTEAARANDLVFLGRWKAAA